MMTGGALDGFGRIFRCAFTVAAVVAVSMPVAAEASTRVCRQLEAQLAGLPTGGGSSRKPQRYDAAIARQQEQIRKARDQGRQAGCGRFMAGAAVAFCGNLNATLERMERNLGELQRTRQRMGAGGDTRRERARINAALDVNGCRAPQRALPPAVDAAPRGPMMIDGRTGLRTGNLSGRFRTLCVRTCDGYFFPVSWSVPQSAFERDQNACAAMCPGTEVELHYHRSSSEEPKDMVSAVTGVAYSEMPNAFRYRQPDAAIAPGCSCTASASPERGFTIIGGDHGSGLPQDEAFGDAAQAPIPVPPGKPDPAEDPETLSSREGGLDAAALKRLATPPRRQQPQPTNGNDEDRSVRVVGPRFLPDPEEAIDLRVPVPARDR
jgi:hypothetical protein